MFRLWKNAAKRLPEIAIYAKMLIFGNKKLANEKR